MKKIANIILIALMLIAAVPMLLWMFGAFGPFEHAANVFGGADVMLAIAAAYLVIGLVVLVGLTIANMGKGRSNSKIGLWVFGGVAILAVIAYFTVAKAQTVIGADGKVFDSVFELKITDTMLYVTYVAVAVAIVVLLGGVVRKALK
ncbi:MAG: hypothetical protein LBU97_04795 [Alistipes sp.]|jgi:hypothetical protein|nr:hypothetical protein [Alistipes sp.]